MEQNIASLTVFEQAWAWLEANKKQVVWGAGILVIVGVIASYYVWSQSAKEVSAGEALSDAMGATLSSGGHGESADALLKVASQYSGTSAGARALLTAAGTLFTQSKYPEAQTQFQKFIRDFQNSPFRSQAMLGVAACDEAMGKPDEAVRHYKELIERHPGDLVIPQARFALARIFEAQNKLNEARELYEDISRDMNRGQGYNSIVSEASVKAEELKAKQPMSASAPKASTTFPILSTQPTIKTNKP